MIQATQHAYRIGARSWSRLLTREHAIRELRFAFPDYDGARIEDALRDLSNSPLCVRRARVDAADNVYLEVL